MKKIAILAILVVLVSSLLAFPVLAAKPDKCTTIQDGVLEYSSGHYLAGQPLQVGFDPYGYNYQGHMFSGSYANSYLGKDGFPPYTGDDEAYLAANPTANTTWYWPYRDVQLMMKWNDAWLSNKDCDDDSLLDRHYGYASGYLGCLCHNPAGVQRPGYRRSRNRVSFSCRPRFWQVQVIC